MAIEIKVSTAGQKPKADPIMKPLVSACLLLAITMAACGNSPFGFSAEEVFTTPSDIRLAKALCKGRNLDAAIAEADTINVMGREGLSLPIWVMGCESPDGLKAILDAGADPNLQGKGPSPVTFAASHPDPQYLKILLKYGGNPSAIENYEDPLYNALMQAFRNGAWNDNWENYYTLLEAGADINYQNSSKWTIATYATIYAQFCKITELLDRGYTQDPEHVIGMINARNEDAPYPECRKEAVERLTAMLDE